MLPVSKKSYWSLGDWFAVIGKATFENFDRSMATVSLTSLTPGKKTSICSSCLSLVDSSTIFSMMVPAAMGC